MSKTPILRTLTTKTRIVHAEGGLHMIRGNGKPYFSLTMASWRIAKNGRREEDCFGAAHDELVKLWPELAPLAALHLSDIDGQPMHGSGNGFYWLAGACLEIGAAKTQYHGGNGSSAKTPDECAEVLARHVRLPLADTRLLIADMLEVFRAVPHYPRVWEGKGIPAVKAAFSAWCDAQAARWKAEADACIAALGLQIFGDPYPVAA